MSLDVTGAGIKGAGSKSKTFWVAGDCRGTLPAKLIPTDA